jgi:hypothetical protein
MMKLGFGACLVTLAMLAAGLTASGAQASTIFTQVDLSGAFNENISTFQAGDAYPVGGPLDINGTPFQLGTFHKIDQALGLGAVIGEGGPETFHIPVNLVHVDSVFTIINSSFGLKGATVGSLTFIDSNDHGYHFDLTEGLNIRSHNLDGFNNDASDLFGSKTFCNKAGGCDAFLDAQKFALGGFVDVKQINFTTIGLPSGEHAHDGTPFLVAVTGGSTVLATPVPGSMPLLATTLVGLAAVSWRRQQRLG